TESPFTVEPDRVQLEISVAHYEYDSRTTNPTDPNTETWVAAPLNVRVGLHPSWELQLIVDGYVDQRVGSSRTRGFGDVVVRAKHNFRGNDGGPCGWGVMPFVVVPVDEDDGIGATGVEGGVIVPFAADLAGGWGFGAMTEVDWVRNDANDGYEKIGRA